MAFLLFNPALQLRELTLIERANKAGSSTVSLVKSLRDSRPTAILGPAKRGLISVRLPSLLTGLATMAGLALAAVVAFTRE